MAAKGQLFSNTIFHKHAAYGSPAVAVVPIFSIAEINILRHRKIFIAQVVARIYLLRNPEEMLRRKHFVRICFRSGSFRALCSVIITLRAHNRSARRKK